MAFDFSNVPQAGSNNNAELASMQEGTMMVCRLSLPDKSFSDMKPAYLVKNTYDGGLINWCYELQVLSPARYVDCIFEGKKPVTLQLQMEKQVNLSAIPNAQKKCVAGDRVVAGILAFDAMVRGNPRKMSIESYDDLEGKFCAVQVARSPQGTKYLQFLSPLFAKEQMTCEMLAQNYRSEQTPHPAQQMPPQMQQPMQQMQQPMPQMQQQMMQQMPQQMPQQMMQQPMQQMQQMQQPMQARVERTYPSQQQTMQYQQWPQMQQDDEDIPF